MFKTKNTRVKFEMLEKRLAASIMLLSRKIQRTLTSYRLCMLSFMPVIVIRVCDWRQSFLWLRKVSSCFLSFKWNLRAGCGLANTRGGLSRLPAPRWFIQCGGSMTSTFGRYELTACYVWICDITEDYKLQSRVYHFNHTYLIKYME